MTIINSTGTQACEVPKNATNIKLVNQGAKVAYIDITTEDGTTSIAKTVDSGQTINCAVTGNGPYTVTNKSNVNVDVTWSWSQLINIDTDCWSNAKMKYYVWLEYYAGPPVSKTVKSKDLMYYQGHQHGVMPDQTQVNTLSQDLIENVDAAYRSYNNQHQHSPVQAPSAHDITANRTVETRSAKGA